MNRMTARDAFFQRWYQQVRLPLILLLLILLWVGLGIPAARVQAQSTIEVIDSSAKPDFPQEITFSLRVKSSAAPITEVELLYGATRLEGLALVEQDFTSGSQIDIAYQLDTQVYYFLPGTDLTYRWLIRDANGNQLETPVQHFPYHDERFPWKQRSTRGVTVYWYEGGEDFGDELIETATRTLDRLQQEIGATVVDPVTIYVYADIPDMRSALQANEVEWVGGLAQPSLGVIVVAAAPGNTAEVKRLLPHELSHQVLHQATDNPYGGLPLWFDEGLAVHSQETLDPDFPRLIEDATESGRLIPLEALSSSFPADPNQARLSYAQSNTMVNYLIESQGAEATQRLVKAFGQAVTVDQALKEAVGMSVDELDATWRETLPDVRSDSIPTPPEEIRAPESRFDGSAVLPPPGSDSSSDLTAPNSRLPNDPSSSAPLGKKNPMSGIMQWVGLGMAGLGCTLMIAIIVVGLIVMGRFFRRGKRPERQE